LKHNGIEMRVVVNGETLVEARCVPGDTPDGTEPDWLSLFGTLMLTGPSLLSVDMRSVAVPLDPRPGPAPEPKPGYASHPKVDEARELAYVMKLAEIENTGERADLKIGPFSAITLIGALHLALQHPGMTGAVRERVLTICRQIYPMFKGTPGEEIIRKGEAAAGV